MFGSPLEIESSIVASQNAIAVNPAVREPQRESETRQQQQQRQTTELPQTQAVTNQQAGAQAFEQAERFRQQQQTFYDQPNAQTREALYAYQSLATQTQREQIQQVVGVDVYA